MVRTSRMVDILFSSGKREPTPTHSDEQRWNNEERDRRRQREAANHGESKRFLHVAARSNSQGERQQPEERAERRHENRTQTNSRGLPKCRLEGESLKAHEVPREVEQDDPVLHDQP